MWSDGRLARLNNPRKVAGIGTMRAQQVSHCSAYRIARAGFLW
jgi:hypothetical protein